MPTNSTCPECGTPLPVDAPQGLCPKCLLRHGMNLTVQSSEPAPTIIAKPTIRYFGDYELDHEIARGGMGAVFKARQVKLNRPVAVKMILEGLLADDAMVKRFYTEAEAAANLQHPNIVAIHEIGAHKGQHYFSMDYVEGKNLAQLTGGKPLAPARAARYVQTMASAIHYAHQRGTLHRDLKPSNVLIDEHDQPRITDFGLAKLTHNGPHLTIDGAVMGTPSYMSPEQAAARQDQVGPHSDVYSLGAILYELLTGKPPFQAATLMATMRAVIESDPVPPRKLNPEVPLDIETICLKCLEKSPQRRYPSARELAEELGRFIKGEPIFARPASLIRKTASWTRQHPRQVAALTALVMLGLIAFVFYQSERIAFYQAQRANPGLTRQRGPRADAADMWRLICQGVPALGLLVIEWWGSSSRSRGIKVEGERGALFGYRPTGNGFRIMAACFGVINIVCAICATGSFIQAYVWEGDSLAPSFLDALLVFFCGWLGLWALYLVVLDYRWSIFGLPSHELTADQNEATRIQPPRSSLRKLYWRRIAICAGIELLVVALLWLLFPQTLQWLGAAGLIMVGMVSVIVLTHESSVN